MQLPQVILRLRPREIKLRPPTNVFPKPEDSDAVMWLWEVEQGIALFSMVPGARTSSHFHDTFEEAYLIIRGQGQIVINGKRQVVQPGDIVTLPRGAAHELIAMGHCPLDLWVFCDPAYNQGDHNVATKGPSQEPSG